MGRLNRPIPPPRGTPRFARGTELGNRRQRSAQLTTAHSGLGAPDFRGRVRAAAGTRPWPRPAPAERGDHSRHPQSSMGRPYSRREGYGPCHRLDCHNGSGLLQPGWWKDTISDQEDPLYFLRGEGPEEMHALPTPALAVCERNACTCASPATSGWAGPAIRSAASGNSSSNRAIALTARSRPFSGSIGPIQATANVTRRSPTVLKPQRGPPKKMVKGCSCN